MTQHMVQNHRVSRSYPYDLFDTPPGKYQWKQLVNKAVYIYHSNRLSPQTEEAQAKSSLKYIYFNYSKDGKVHNI
jgi:hypothetical protein